MELWSQLGVPPDETVNNLKTFYIQLDRCGCARDIANKIAVVNGMDEGENVLFCFGTLKQYSILSVLAYNHIYLIKCYTIRWIK